MTRFFKLLPLLIGLGAVGWLCARFGFSDLRAAFAHVSVARLMLYVGAEVMVLIGYSVRWRAVAQAVGGDLPLRRFVAARVAGAAVGALLPGKVAGDPVRAALVYA